MRQLLCAFYKGNGKHASVLKKVHSQNFEPIRAFLNLKQQNEHIIPQRMKISLCQELG